ncbi:MarR family winged helix-turn-helix transcriptional regulator [Nocardia wallacei]|uniref:MarR family transcriptional regulator n=1 Tax=Nocardia wallacei TaxID=480035 RepID=A0A7G1KEN6_9NOCA|nr:MarR family transcriptional regulator [Nocardia wallacei]BCK52996.1 MarR family transcriptional regulator [Nocardia wallacei]
MTGASDARLDEPDLAALIARVLPRLVALEEPILADAGLSMWEYAIVAEVASSAAMSQRELSRRTRRDPTRLGRHLDDLVSRGIIRRERSHDQRQRTVCLTPSGRALFTEVHTKIRAMEDDLLRTALSVSDATTLRHLLTRLATACE